MTTKTNTNGQASKTLAEQIDRLDADAGRLVKASTTRWLRP